MVSDDTEHTCMAALALIDAEGDLKKFSSSLARRFRYWLVGLPPGTGFATLRAICKLWLGFAPEHSGVFSAGNGPVMRAAIFGAVFDDFETVRAYVTASTQITHTDPKALYSALAVALAAMMARQTVCVQPDDYLAGLRRVLAGQGSELVNLVVGAVESVKINQTTSEYTASIGLCKGVSGYVYHTVPAVIHAWLRHQRDFRAGIIEMIECGGDTDTTAAILGGIVGCAAGKDGIPAEWLQGIWEWPGSISWMEQLGGNLAAAIKGQPRPGFSELHLYEMLPRNLLLLTVVLFHGLRRLFPPY
jgi:ADP-ribosylglycohydrolase